MKVIESKTLKINLYTIFVAAFVIELEKMSEPSTCSSSSTKRTRTKRGKGKRKAVGKKNVKVKVNRDAPTWPYIEMLLQKIKGLDTVNNQLSTIDPSILFQSAPQPSDVSSQESMAKYYLQSIVQTTIPAEYPHCLKHEGSFGNTVLLTFDKDKCTQAFATNSDNLKDNPYDIADPIMQDFVDYYLKKATGPPTGKFTYMAYYWQLVRHFESWAKGLSIALDGAEDDVIPFIKCIVSLNDESNGEFEKVLVPIHVPFYMFQCQESLLWFLDYLFSMKHNPPTTGDVNLHMIFKFVDTMMFNEDIKLPPILYAYCKFPKLSYEEIFKLNL